MVTCMLSTLIALGYTPFNSGGSLRDVVACELSAPFSAWWTGISNVRHIIAYGVLCVLATACFVKHRLAKAVGGVLVISMLVESEQAFFTHGHCRVRDMLPNLLAVCIAVLLWTAVSFARGSARNTSAT
jgi:hypothetical protein